MNIDSEGLEAFKISFRCVCPQFHTNLVRVSEFDHNDRCPNNYRFVVNRAEEPNEEEKEKYWDILQRLISFDDELAVEGSDLVYFSILADYLMRVKISSKLPSPQGISSQSLLGHLINTNGTGVLYELVNQIKLRRAYLENSGRSDLDLMGYGFLLEGANEDATEITVEELLDPVLAINKRYRYKKFVFRFPMARDYWLNQAIRFDDRALALLGVLKKAHLDMHQLALETDELSSLETIYSEPDENDEYERKMLRLRQQANDARAGRPSNDFNPPTWTGGSTWVYWPNRWGKSGGRWQKYDD